MKEPRPWRDCAETIAVIAAGVWIGVFGGILTVVFFWLCL
jgi:hypothetical protein